MALIKCPECGKDVSERAVSCPLCGYPFEVKIDSNSNTPQAAESVFPELPEKLDVGKIVGRWNLDYTINGEYLSGHTPVAKLTSGKLSVMRTQYGIIIQGAGRSWTNLLKIHDRQIISFQKINRDEFVQEKRSFLKRSFSGGVLTGGVGTLLGMGMALLPVGAIYGGVSSLKSKKKVEEITYFIINFWEIESRSEQSIIIKCMDADVDKFIAAYDKPVVNKPMPKLLIFSLILIVLTIVLLIIF